MLDHSLKQHSNIFEHYNTVTQYRSIPSILFSSNQALLYRVQQTYKTLTINLLMWAKIREKNWALLHVDLHTEIPREKQERCYQALEGPVWWCWNHQDCFCRVSPKGVFAKGLLRCPQVLWERCWKAAPWEKAIGNMQKIPFNALGVDGRDLILKAES